MGVCKILDLSIVMLLLALFTLTDADCSNSGA